MNRLFSQMLNNVTCGDCIDVMAHMPARSIDFVLTDPPYLVRYRDRSGRRVINDDNDAWLKPAFAQIHRVLKPDSLCVSFYGWNKADVFMSAWRDAWTDLFESGRSPQRPGREVHLDQLEHVSVSP
jgi:DNA modification methylase